MPKEQFAVIGKIGSNDVVDFKGNPCIVFNGKMIGKGKIKMVLANLEACRRFIVEYDKPKTAPVAAPAVVVPAPVIVAAPVPAPAPVAAAAPLGVHSQSKEELATKLAALQAQLASLNAASAAKPVGRFTAA